MSGIDIVVSPRSRKEIQRLTEQIRKVCALDKQVYFPVIPFFELALPHLVEGFTYLIADPMQFKEEGGSPGTHAFSQPDANRIVLLEQVYEGALNEVGRDHATVAHEIGHLLMHRGVRLHRTVQPGAIPAYMSSEWQAKAFAGELLVCKRLVAARRWSAEEIAEHCGVSVPVARIQMSSW